MLGARTANSIWKTALFIVLGGYLVLGGAVTADGGEKDITNFAAVNS